MKKSIKTIALALLTTGMLAGCGNGGGSAPAESKWGKQVSTMMKLLAGEELPYVELDLANANIEFDACPDTGYLAIEDLSEVNQLENYGELLLANGFTYDEEMVEYTKSQEGGYDVSVQFSYTSPNRSRALGNFIYIYAQNNGVDYTAFARDWYQNYFAACGVDVGTLPNYEIASENESWSYESWSSSSYAYGYGTNRDEIESYKDALVKAGWTINGEQIYYEDEEQTIIESIDYVFKFEGKGDYDAYISTVDYLYEEEDPCLAIGFYVDKKQSYLTAEEVIGDIANYVGAQPEELEEGVYGVMAAFPAATYSVEAMKGYVTNVFVPEEFEAQGDWQQEEDGTYYLGFVNPIMTAIESYVYAETLWVKDGTIVDEGTEGAEAVEATCLEIYAYQIYR